MKKRLLATLLLSALCLMLLSGCGGGSSGTAKKTSEVKELSMSTAAKVYAAENMDFPQALWFCNMGNIAAQGGKIYLVGSFLESRYIYSLNSDGTGLELVAAKEDRNENWFTYCADGEKIYIYDNYNNCLINYSTAGDYLGSIAIPESVTIFKLAATDGRLYALGGGKLSALRIDGDKAELDYSLSADDPASFIVNSAGELIVARKDGEKQAISRLDSGAKSWGETRYLDTACAIAGAGADGGLYMNINDALYSYSLTSGEAEKLLSFSELGLAADGAVCELDAGRFLYTGTSGNISAEKPYILSPVSLEGEPVNLTIATTDALPYPLDVALRDWNRAHPEAPLTLCDYSVYNTGDDPQGGERKLIMDVTSGNAPDIYNLSDSATAMNASLLTRRGLLADLNPFLEQDSGLNRSDFIEGALKCLETDGKLYQIAPSFRLLSCTAPLRDVGAAEIYSYSQLEQLTAEYGGYYQKLFNGIYTRDNWLETMVSATGAKLVDWQSGQCNFNSEYFIRLLELSCKQPLERELTDGNFANYLSASGALLNMYELDSVWLAGSMADYYGAGNCAFVGLPELGQVLIPSFSMGVSAQSTHKEQCWEFIRQFLVKDTAYKGYISLRRDGVQQQMLDELEQMKQYPVEHPGRAELMQDFLNVLENISAVYQQDAAILRIVKEETNKLYDSRCTASEAAQAIQSRASIYVAEQCG